MCNVVAASSVARSARRKVQADSRDVGETFYVSTLCFVYLLIAARGTEITELSDSPQSSRNDYYRMM